jgi:hypothetical protein
MGCNRTSAIMVDNAFGSVYPAGTPAGPQRALAIDEELGPDRLARRDAADSISHHGRLIH